MLLLSAVQEIAKADSGSSFRDNITILLSLIAVAISVISMRQKRYEGKRLLRMQLSDVTDKLNAVAMDNAKAYGEAMARQMERMKSAGPLGMAMPMDQAVMTDPIFASVSTIQSQQGLTHARQAIFLMEQIPELVSDVEYSSLAASLQNIGDLPLADQYWQKAVDAAAKSAFLPMQKRGYAQFLFFTGNVERGRQLYQESLLATPGDTDYALYTRALTYRYWGVAEWNFVSHDSGRAKLAEAEASIRRIRTDVLREGNLAQLNAVRGDLERNAKENQPPPAPGAGFGAPRPWVAPDPSATPSPPGFISRPPAAPPQA